MSSICQILCQALKIQKYSKSQFTITLPIVPQGFGKNWLCVSLGLARLEMAEHELYVEEWLVKYPDKLAGRSEVTEKLEREQ